MAVSYHLIGNDEQLNKWGFEVYDKVSLFIRFAHDRRLVFSLLLLCRKLRQSSSAVATSRKGRRPPRSGRESQHRRWGRALERVRAPKNK
jgi:hypothetical protein